MIESFLFSIFTMIFQIKEINEIRDVLKIVESKNNTKAIGDGGKAYGVLQIHPIAVREVNLTYGTNYKHSDMFNEKKSDEVFFLLIMKGIKLYKEKYGRDPSEKDIVRMWNGGIYNGHKKTSTLPYYKKYLQVKYDR